MHILSIFSCSVPSFIISKQVKVVVDPELNLGVRYRNAHWMECQSTHTHTHLP